MKILKTKQGFTLIELLVVIGILAVLAAIAIPSVAGLIDRANVSADETNANEMTNAIERFASEYELYVQDIGNGALNPNDLDSAQGRVYNVTGATTRGDITAIEKAQSVKVADVGDEVAIYRDTKYPVNNATLHKIVENYMKTSSSTFEPKQSDCNYYYSPDCGLVVCTETDKAEVTDLNALVVSGKDAKGKELGPQTQWINITDPSLSPTQNISENKIKFGTTYVAETYYDDTWGYDSSFEVTFYEDGSYHFQWIFPENFDVTLPTGSAIYSNNFSIIACPNAYDSYEVTDGGNTLIYSHNDGYGTVLHAK